MEWILILYYAFAVGQTGGAVAIDHIEFYTKQQCEETAQKIMSTFDSVNNNKNFYTADDWLHKFENRKYLCVHREKPNKEVNKNED